MGGAAWTEEEDQLLKKSVKQYGEGKWHRIPWLAGLNRCRKSCRLRWINYLRPNIKRGSFSDGEVDLIVELHKLLGNRWSLIAGRLPGRTANDVKNYWNCHLSKKLNSKANNADRDQRSRSNTKDDQVVLIMQPQLPRNFAIAAAAAASSSPIYNIPEPDQGPEPLEESSNSNINPSLLIISSHSHREEEENKISSDWPMDLELFGGVRGITTGDDHRMKCKSKWDLDDDLIFDKDDLWNDLPW